VRATTLPVAEKPHVPPATLAPQFPLAHSMEPALCWHPSTDRCAVIFRIAFGMALRTPVRQAGAINGRPTLLRLQDGLPFRAMSPRSGSLRTFRRPGLPTDQPVRRWCDPRERGVVGPRPRKPASRCITVNRQRRRSRGLVMRGGKSAPDEATHAWGSVSRQEGEGNMLATEFPAPTGARLSWARITRCRPGNRLTSRP
jgi:hypothetical protein